jgi:hypothetical protein
MEAHKSKIRTQNYLLDLIFKTFLIICFLLSVLSFVPKVRAEGVSLRIAPSLLQLRVVPPTVINAPVTIENTSADTLKIDTHFKEFKASPDANGTIAYLPDSANKPAIFKMIELVEGEQTITSLTLPPKQKRQLKLKITLEENVQPQDIYFSIVFLATPPTITLSNASSNERTSLTTVHGGVAMNILLSILPATKDTSSPAITIEEFSAPTLTEKGPLPFTVKIRNNSTKYINPKGNITITNMFGQTIGKIDLKPDTILANSSRYLSDQSKKPIANSHQPKVFWQENFLLGPYEARLTLKPSPESEEIQKTTSFIGLPTRAVVAFIATILLLVAIIRRVRIKMKSA